MQTNKTAVFLLPVVGLIEFISMTPHADTFRALLLRLLYLICIMGLRGGPETVKPELQEWSRPKGRRPARAGKEGRHPFATYIGPFAPHNTAFLSLGPDSRACQKLRPHYWVEG